MPRPFTTVATCWTIPEAESLRGLLASEGIDAAIADERLLTVDPLLLPALGFARLEVRTEDAARALEILRGRVRPRGPSTSVTDGEACPACRASLPDHATVCSACGWSFLAPGETEAPSATPPPSPPPARGRGTRVAWLVIALWCLYWAAAESMWSLFRPPEEWPPWSFPPHEVALVVLALAAAWNWIASPDPPPGHPIFAWLSDPSLFVRACGYVSAVVGAPLAEEVVFRGAVYRFLRDESAGLPTAAGIAVAAVGSSFVFAICHLQGWGAIPPLMIFGIVAAMLREWRGSLVASMALHAAAWAHLVADFAAGS